MTRRTKLIIASAVAAGAIAAGTGAGIAATTGGDEEPLTGVTREQAVQAALKHAGPGNATEAAIGDDGAFYEVEITRPDGSQVEVHLDRNLQVTGDEPDDDGKNDRNEGGEK